VAQHKETGSTDLSPDEQTELKPMADIEDKKSDLDLPTVTDTDEKVAPPNEADWKLNHGKPLPDIEEEVENGEDCVHKPADLQDLEIAQSVVTSVTQILESNETEKTLEPARSICTETSRTERVIEHLSHTNTKIDPTLQHKPDFTKPEADNDINQTGTEDAPHLPLRAVAKDFDGDACPAANTGTTDAVPATSMELHESSDVVAQSLPLPSTAVQTSAIQSILRTIPSDFDSILPDPSSLGVSLQPQCSKMTPKDIEKQSELSAHIYSDLMKIPLEPFNGKIPQGLTSQIDRPPGAEGEGAPNDMSLEDEVFKSDQTGIVKSVLEAIRDETKVSEMAFNDIPKQVSSIPDSSIRPQPQIGCVPDNYQPSVGYLDMDSLIDNPATHLYSEQYPDLDMYDLHDHGDGECLRLSNEFMEMGGVQKQDGCIYVPSGEINLPKKVTAFLTWLCFIISRAATMCFKNYRFIGKYR